MYFLIEYLLFAAKALTVAALCLLPLVVIALILRSARRHRPETRLTVDRINDQLLDLELDMQAGLLPPKRFKQLVKVSRKQRKAARDEPRGRRLFVCDFEGDLRAEAVASLRREISAVLSVATPEDEVLVVLESGGGTIHGYGLAASQLQRLRDRNIELTVAVDKIAASGGYMMACVANRILAAPFAIIGSIGVVAQVPNFNRLLRKHDIDFELITAGKYKRTLTMFGENTEEGRDKFQADIDEAHALFKSFVAQHRPALDIERVGTGEYWFGTRALQLGLVDELATSDAYLIEAARTRDVYRIRFARPRSLIEKMFAPVRGFLHELRRQRAP
ncbi:MAG: protease SohB [Proteobacteria bacterium]|nr:protease SohB [Pseudomonadota bacterium]